RRFPPHVPYGQLISRRAWTTIGLAADPVRGRLAGPDRKIDRTSALWSRMAWRSSSVRADAGSTLTDSPFTEREMPRPASCAFRRSAFIIPPRFALFLQGRLVRE